MLASMDSDNVMSDEAPVAAHTFLVQLSAEIDRQLTTLTGLLSGAASESLDDRQVVQNIVHEYSLELESLNGTLTGLEATQKQAKFETDALLARLNQLISRPSPATPQSSQSNATNGERPSSKFATPLRVAIASTPKSAIRTNHIDFDAFPRTPTLEQLGLSKAALAVVKDHRHGRSSLKNRVHPSSSDMESDLSMNLRHSFGSISASIATPRMTELTSDSSLGSRPHLNTRLSSFASSTESNLQNMQNSMDISSTPTVRNGLTNTSPFGAVPSSNVFAGRISDAFSSHTNNELGSEL